MTSWDRRQALGVQRWVDAGCRGSLEYPTGFGKTNTALLAIRRFLKKNGGSSVYVVVPTEHLQKQWRFRFAEEGLEGNCEVEIINTAVKQERHCGLLVLDEIHAYAAPVFGTVFDMVKYSMVLGLTATMERLDGKHEMLERHCPVVDRISIGEATEKGWLSPYTEYKVMLDVDLTPYKELNGRFYGHFSFFNYDFALAMSCVGKDGWKRREAYARELCKDPSRMQDVRAMVTAHSFGFMDAMAERKAFIYNHPKKVEACEYILKHREGCKAITFSPTINVAEKIGIGHVCHSRQGKKKRAMTVEEFNNMDSGVLNTSKALDVGADIMGLNLAVILCNSSSKTQKTQRIGRAIRFAPGKKAEVFTLVLRGTVEDDWFRKSSEGKKYIVIDEDGLHALMEGREPVPKQERADKVVLRY